jgi:hypothetical protein
MFEIQKEMRTRFNNTEREKLFRQKVIFCTECGIELQNFCFSEGANNPNAIRKNLAQCKKTGKFAGEFCSKLFIVDDNHLESLFEKDEL